MLGFGQKISLSPTNKNIISAEIWDTKLETQASHFAKTRRWDASKRKLQNFRLNLSHLTEKNVNIVYYEVKCLGRWLLSLINVDNVKQISHFLWRYIFFRLASQKKSKPLAKITEKQAKSLMCTFRRKQDMRIWGIAGHFLAVGQQSGQRLGRGP